MDAFCFKAVVDTPPQIGRALSVRLCREDELPLFHELMRQHHYLKGGRSAGDTLRYFAEVDGRIVGLLTWGAAAYKLKHRDHWRGTRLRVAGAGPAQTTPQTRGAKPPLLPADQAWRGSQSRLPGARCLSAPPARRLAGALRLRPLGCRNFCRSAAGAGHLLQGHQLAAAGPDGGQRPPCARFYQRHDQPKTLWCLELVKDARRLLADPVPLPPECQAGVTATAVKGSAAGYATCQSLMEVFARLPDPRSMSGRRYPQRQLLAILALGMLCGCRDLQAIVILGQQLSQEQLRGLGGLRRQKTGLYEAPGYNAYYHLIGKMDAAAFDSALCQWLDAHEGRLPRDLALDGKVLRGTADENGRRLALIALIENQTQRPVAQQATRLIADDEGSKQEGELTAARRLLEQVPALDHAVITGDAMFTRHDIAQSIVADKGGDYLLAIKDNNPTLAGEVRARFDAAIHGKAKGHERPFFGKAR